MPRLVERLALAGSLSVLGVALLSGAKDPEREVLVTRLAALELRFAALERATARSAVFGSTFRAPFIVTTADDRPIFSVTSSPRQVNFFADSGIVASIGVSEGGGGYFKASSTKNKFEAVMEVRNVAPQFTLKSVLGNIGAFYAGKDGTTSLVLRNTKTGLVTVALSQDAKGNGILNLLTAAGGLMVEAGVSETNVGLVHVGPRGNCSGKMGLAATDCIFGHK